MVRGLRLRVVLRFTVDSRIASRWQGFWGFLVMYSSP